MKVFVAITGASGSIYGRQLIERLGARDEIERVWVSFTDNGRRVFDLEQPGYDVAAMSKVRLLQPDDMFSPPASGSASVDVMVIAPCSMGTAGRVACGVSDTLISRAADVMLKERRKLILVVRETPWSLVHLRNMTALAEAGATIVPAAPSFYFAPQTIEELSATVTDRVMAQMGFEQPRQWGE